MNTLPLTLYIGKAINELEPKRQIKIPDREPCYHAAYIILSDYTEDWVLVS